MVYGYLGSHKLFEVPLINTVLTPRAVDFQKPYKTTRGDTDGRRNRKGTSQREIYDTLSHAQQIVGDHKVLHSSLIEVLVSFLLL
jgi:hypothetical protein